MRGESVVWLSETRAISATFGGKSGAFGRKLIVFHREDRHLPIGPDRVDHGSKLLTVLWVSCRESAFIGVGYQDGNLQKIQIYIFMNLFSIFISRALGEGDECLDPN
jgi:hypothetical protein